VSQIAKKTRLDLDMEGVNLKGKILNKEYTANQNPFYSYNFIRVTRLSDTD